MFRADICDPITVADLVFSAGWYRTLMGTTGYHFINFFPKYCMKSSKNLIAKGVPSAHPIDLQLLNYAQTNKLKTVLTRTAGRRRKCSKATYLQR